ncbi:response regulator [Nocardioides ferulae]|uniref:response regulator n=1 Tax=Nocardioides ferulae TaxID=2340821 RepID=UPI0013DDF6CC|nr:response regulator [Nocardioides ferulae]
MTPASSTPLRVLAGLLTALAIVGATYAGVSALRGDARAAEEAATRLVALRLDMFRMLDIPWGASPAETDRPQRVVSELLGAEQTVRAEVDDLTRSPGLPEREEFLEHFDRSVETLEVVLAAVAAQDDDAGGNAGTVAARQMYRADAVLRQAARRFQAEADRSARQEAVGSMVLIGVLFLAFAAYYVRSVRSRAALAGAATELAEARDAALDAASYKSAFLATMSHEIRTPLGGLIGLNELLLRTPLDPYQQQLATGADASGRTLLRLVNDVLDLSKIEAGRLVLESIDFDLRTVLDEVAVVLGIQARSKGIELVVSCAPDVPERLRGDPTRLGQVVFNLTSNALKFTSAGEVSVRALAYDQVTRTAVLRVDVSDSGPGVAPDEREVIFEPYAQGDASTTRKHGGTGLGLAIARQIVEAMGGTIGVDDAPGGGALFWFTVPLVPAAGPSPMDADESGSGAGSLAGRRILVVDDNATSRMVLCEQLEQWQATTAAAPGGPEALALLAASAEAGEPFDAVLVDRAMPEMDGPELIGRIRAGEALADLSILLLSSAPDPRAEGVVPGVATILTKPVPAHMLRDAVSKLFAPRAVARPAAPNEVGAPGADPRDAVGGEPRVLVVDDDEVNRLVAGALLTSMGYRPVEAADGEEAVEAFQGAAAGPFAAVLMDVHMPRLDGHAATRAIRDLEGGRSRVPILALTATAVDTERADCLDVGMDDLLTKPLGREELRAALDTWVRRDASDSSAPHGSGESRHVRE